MKYSKTELIFMHHMKEHHSEHHAKHKSHHAGHKKSHGDMAVKAKIASVSGHKKHSSKGK